MIAIWWPNGRDRCSTRTRSSAAASSSRISRGAVGRAVVDDDQLERDPLQRDGHAAVELARESPSSSIGATTLSRRSERSGMD